MRLDSVRIFNKVNVRKQYSFAGCSLCRTAAYGVSNRIEQTLGRMSEIGSLHV